MASDDLLGRLCFKTSDISKQQEATSLTAAAAFSIYAISTADIKEYPKYEKIWKDIFKLR